MLQQGSPAMKITLKRPAEKYFFLIVLPLAIAIEWAFARSHDWAAYPRSEWVALFDLCVFMPIIYGAFFTSDLNVKTRLLRCAAIAGIGLFAASFIVPAPNQIIIGELSNIRNAMLVFILLFEGFIFWKVVDALYRKRVDAKALQQDFAMPEWVAKLMVMEAKFWKAVWSLFRRK
jgi:hypothetical protein